MGFGGFEFDADLAGYARQIGSLDQCAESPPALGFGELRFESRDAAVFSDQLKSARGSMAITEQHIF